MVPAAARALSAAARSVSWPPRQLPTGRLQAFCANEPALQILFRLEEDAQEVQHCQVPDAVMPDATEAGCSEERLSALTALALICPGLHA